MPRKSRYKNRYCFNTRLNEAQLDVLIRSWSLGMTAEYAAKTYNEWHRTMAHAGTGLVRLSRETVYKYFMDIGTYAWIVSDCGHVARLIKEQKQKKEFDAECRQELDAWVEVTHGLVFHTVDPLQIRKDLYAPFRPLVAGYMAKVWELLGTYFAVANGFSKKYTHTYMARAYCIAAFMDGDEEGNEAEKHTRAAIKLSKFIEECMRRYPLRKRLPLEVLPWADGWATGTKWV